MKSNYTLRLATEADLHIIIEMMTDDVLAQQRQYQSESDYKKYLNAFNKIANDPNANLYVITQANQVIGCAQLNYLTHLTFTGGTRAQIEGVRVHKNYRDKGIGSIFIQQLIQLAKEHGCHMVQLMTDKQRAETLKFYEKLGFINTHHGMKLHL